MPWKSKEKNRLKQQEYREANRELTNRTALESYYRRRERVLAKMSVQYREEREWYNALKAGPCADCGLCFPPCAMDFDHVRGRKMFTIGRMINKSKSRKAIVKEMAKCELVCSNCHRLRTWASDRPIKGNTKRKNLPPEQGLDVAGSPVTNSV